MNFRNERAEKILEYATAFVIFLFFATLFSRWFYKSDFYPAWFVFALFVLSLISLYVFLKSKNGQIQQTEKSPIRTPKAEEIKMPRESFNEIYRRESEAHEFIVKLCESKNIRLTLKQQGSSGHCEIPEIWTLERAVPLTPDDLYALTANETISAVTELHDDGVIYAESFSRSAGWTVYEQEN